MIKNNLKAKNKSRAKFNLNKDPKKCLALNKKKYKNITIEKLWRPTIRIKLYKARIYN